MNVSWISGEEVPLKNLNTMKGFFNYHMIVTVDIIKSHFHMKSIYENYPRKFSIIEIE